MRSDSQCLQHLASFVNSSASLVMKPFVLHLRGMNEILFLIEHLNVLEEFLNITMGAQWLSGRVLDSRPRGSGFEPHRRHCVVSLSKNINPSLLLVQPRKTCLFITERLLMGRKESNKQTNK